MRVLVACEESQEVCKAFRALGHEAYSCDLQACSGGHPEWHIMHDAVEVAYTGQWDLMIAHPPCTYITCAANRAHKMFPEREQKRIEAIQFFKKLYDAPIERKCLENPKGVLSSRFRRPDQYVQPFNFGHKESKLTGLWLVNLPWIYPTEIVEPIYKIGKNGDRYNPTHWRTPSTKNPENAKLRSKTFPGIARAMAMQWGGKIN